MNKLSCHSNKVYISETKRVIRKVQNFFQGPLSPDEVFCAYYELRKIGYKWRKHFTYKGIYKVAQIHFIRETVFYLVQHQEAWSYVPTELRLDIEYKARNNRVSVYIADSLISFFNRSI